MKAEISLANGSVAEIADFEKFIIGNTTFKAEDFKSRTIPIDKEEICTFVGQKELLTTHANNLVCIKLNF